MTTISITTTLSPVSAQTLSLSPLPPPLTSTHQTTLKLRRRRKRQLDGLCCLSPYCRALALCCPFPFNCIACSGLALSACPLSQKAKLQVLLQLTARSKQYLWVAGKAAAWFTLFGALAFAATYQLKVRRDERMYGIRRGPKDFIISSTSSSTSTSSSFLQLPSPWLMITGALFTIVSLVALVVYFRRRRRRRRKQTMIRTSCRTRRISRRRSSESKKRKRRGKEKAAAAKHTTTTSKNNNVIMRRSNSN